MAKAPKGTHVSVVADPAPRLSRFNRVSRFSKFLTRFSKKTHYSSLVRKSLAEYVCEELDVQSRMLFYQRVHILAKNIMPTTPNVTADNGLSEEPKLDFKEMFTVKLYEILCGCQEEAFSNDQVSGLFLCMGDYTLLIIEGTEEICGEFCIQLSSIAHEWFSANRVFLVDDNIGTCYFDGFFTCRSAAIHLNEKFPPSTNSDFELLSEQHCIIRDKIRGLCSDYTNMQRLSTFYEGQNLLMYIPADIPDKTLPSEQFQKFLPEVQRIDIVLSCTKFYRTLKKFVVIYKNVSLHDDETALVWPASYNYLPLGIFERFPFDVNLTFSDYGKKDEKGEGTQEEDSENTEKA